MSDESQLVLGANSGPFSAVASVPDGVDGGHVVFLLSKEAGELSCYHSITRQMTRLMTGIASPVHLAVNQRSAARVFDIVYSEKLRSSARHGGHNGTDSATTFQDDEKSESSATGGVDSDDYYALHLVNVRVAGAGEQRSVVLTSSSSKKLFSSVRQLRGLAFAAGHLFFSSVSANGLAVNLHSVEAFDCAGEIDDFDDEVTALFERNVGLVATLIDRRQRRRARATVVDLDVDSAKVLDQDGLHGASANQATNSNWETRSYALKREYLSVAVLLGTREVFTLKIMRQAAQSTHLGTQTNQPQHSEHRSVWQPANSWVGGQLPCFPTAGKSLCFIGAAHPRALLCAGAAPAGLATLSNISASELRGWQITSFRAVVAASGCTLPLKNSSSSLVDSVIAVYFVEIGGSLRCILDIHAHTAALRASWAAEQASSPQASNSIQDSTVSKAKRQTLNRPIGTDPALDYGPSHDGDRFVVGLSGSENCETGQPAQLADNGDTENSASSQSSSSPTRPAQQAVVWYDGKGNRKLVDKGSSSDFHKWLDDLMEASTFLKLGRVPQCNAFNVYLRCRPMLMSEVQNGARPILHCVDRRSVYVESYNQYQRPKSFVYDKVFAPSDGQEDFFRLGIAPLIYKALNGYNCTIFAYGQTGTGKTHTMQGNMDDPSSMGAIPRAVLLVMRLLDDLPAHLQWNLQVSHLEIYNEELYDLLDRAQKTAARRERRRKSLMKSSLTLMKTLRFMRNKETGQVTSNDGGGVVAGPAEAMRHQNLSQLDAPHRRKQSRHTKFDQQRNHQPGEEGSRFKKPNHLGSETAAGCELRMLRDPHTRATKVHGLKRVSVDSASAIFKVLNQTIAERATHATDMNDRSSRSHAIFTLYITIDSKEAVNDDLLPAARRSQTTSSFRQCTRLNFVDLSGSENAKKSGSTGDRAREATFINQGLLALGRVLKALGRRFDHIDRQAEQADGHTPVVGVSRYNGDDSRKNPKSQPWDGTKRPTVPPDEKHQKNHQQHHEVHVRRRDTENSYVHVPFRESKLTRFLEDSLGGDSVTAMILTVSPNHSHVEEAVNTLSYANLATKILNLPQLKFHNGNGPREHLQANDASATATAGSAMRQILRERIAHAQASQHKALQAVHAGSAGRNNVSGKDHQTEAWMAPPWESHVSVRRSHKPTHAKGVGGMLLRADADGRLFEEFDGGIDSNLVNTSVLESATSEHHQEASRIQAAFRGSQARDLAYVKRFERDQRTTQLRQKIALQGKREAAQAEADGDDNDDDNETESTELFGDAGRYIQSSITDSDNEEDDDVTLGTVEAEWTFQNPQSASLSKDSQQQSRGKGTLLDSQSHPRRQPSVTSEKLDRKHGTRHHRTRSKSRSRTRRSSHRKKKCKRHSSAAASDGTGHNVARKQTINLHESPEPSPTDVAQLASPGDDASSTIFSDALADGMRAAEMAQIREFLSTQYGFDLILRQPLKPSNAPSSTADEADRTGAAARGPAESQVEMAKIRQFLAQEYGIQLVVQEDSSSRLAKVQAEREEVEAKRAAARAAAIEYRRMRQRARAQQAERLASERRLEKEERERAKQYSRLQREKAAEAQARKDGTMRQLRQRRRREATLEKRRKAERAVENAATAFNTPGAKKKVMKATDDMDGEPSEPQTLGSKGARVDGNAHPEAPIGKANRKLASPSKKWSLAARRIKQHQETSALVQSTRAEIAARRAALQARPHIKAAPTGQRQREGWTDTYHGASVAWAKSVFLDTSGRRPSARARAALLQIFARFHTSPDINQAVEGGSVVEVGKDGRVEDGAPTVNARLLVGIEHIPMMPPDINTLALVVRSSITASGGSVVAGRPDVSPGSTRHRDVVSHAVTYDRRAVLTFSGFASFATHMAQRDPRALQKFLSFCGVSTSLDQKTSSSLLADMKATSTKFSGRRGTHKSTASRDRHVDGQQQSGGGAVVPLTRTRLRTLRTQAARLIKSTATSLPPDEREKLPSSSIWAWTTTREARGSTNLSKQVAHHATSPRAGTSSKASAARHRT